MRNSFTLVTNELPNGNKGRGPVVYAIYCVIINETSCLLHYNWLNWQGYQPKAWTIESSGFKISKRNTKYIHANLDNQTSFQLRSNCQICLNGRESDRLGRKVKSLEAECTSPTSLFHVLPRVHNDDNNVDKYFITTTDNKDINNIDYRGTNN